MTQWRVMAEPRAEDGGTGKPVLLRGGFPSREAAEDHSVTLSLWARVWVEKTPPEQERQPARDYPPPLPWTVERTLHGHYYVIDAEGQRIASLLGSIPRREHTAALVYGWSRGFATDSAFRTEGGK